MNKRNCILLGFILLKFLLQYILISPEYDLHRDEYLHLDQAHHLAWGYLSVPPFTSWISSLIYILGNSVFWVKFFPALFGALTIVVVWKAVEELEGSLFALILSATCVLFSALLATNTLYQPNSFDVLSWTTFYFFFIKYLKTENPKWLYLAALVFGIGFYYTKNKKVVAHSFNADYINWLPFDREITDVVLVKVKRYDDDRDRKKETPFFDTVYLATQRINQYAREDTISIYVLKGAKIDVNKVIKDETDKIKN